MVTNYKGLSVNNDNGYECTCSNFIGIKLDIIE